MQAIQTKVLPATNFRPTRIKAWCARGSIVVSYESLGSNSYEYMHVHAAIMLIDKFVKEDAKSYGEIASQNPWKRDFVSGCLPNGDFAHVFIS